MLASQQILSLGFAVLALASLLALLLNVIAWRKVRKLLQHSLSLSEAHSKAHSQDQARSQREVPAALLVDTLTRLERRIVELEHSLKQRSLQRPLAPPAVVDTMTDSRYEKAQELVQASQTAEQVARGSGLTLYEAELLLRIHRGGSAAP